MAPQSKIRLLVAGGQEVLRNGVKAMLVGTDVKVVGEAASGRAAVNYALIHAVDVVLLNARMPEGDSLAALGRIKRDKPDLAVLMFSTYSHPACVAQAVAQGASGYLLKNCSRDNLHSAIRKAAAGERLFTHEALRRMSRLRAAPCLVTDLEIPLTWRESEVLQQMGKGLTNKQIAKVLGISYETVKEHVQQVLRKIGLTDRTQAAVWAVRKGLA